MAAEGLELRPHSAVLQFEGNTMKHAQVLRRLLTMIASIIVLANMAAMVPASAVAFDCPQMAMEDSSTRHEHGKGPVNCCSDMQCCPIVPQPIEPCSTVRIQRTVAPALVIDTALLLIWPIDPPPRSEGI